MEHTHITKKYQKESGFTPTPRISQSFSVKQKTPQYDWCRGFTLAETLVGIFIFTLAFMALASVNANSLQDINITSRKLIAEYLAEEGVEYVKYLQKSYENDPTPKASFLSDITNSTSGCTVSPNVPCDFYLDPSSQTVSEHDYVAPLNQWPYGLLVAQSILYPGLSSVSPYERRIYIEDISSNALQSQAVKVTSQVTYFSGQQPVVVTAIIHFNF